MPMHAFEEDTVAVGRPQSFICRNLIQLVVGLPRQLLDCQDELSATRRCKCALKSLLSVRACVPARYLMKFACKSLVKTLSLLGDELSLSQPCGLLGEGVMRIGSYLILKVCNAHLLSTDTCGGLPN